MTAIKPQLKPEWPAITQKGQSREGEVPPPNPWQGVEDAMGATGSRRRWARDVKGATPPRDGPWSPSAAVLARLLPPRARTVPPVRRK